MTERLDDQGHGDKERDEAVRLAHEFLSEPDKRETAIRAVRAQIGPKTAGMIEEAVTMARYILVTDRCARSAGGSTSERQKSAGMCMYCGHVFHAADTSEPEVARVYHEAIAHDQQCQSNPLVKRIAELSARSASKESTK